MTSIAAGLAATSSSFAQTSFYDPPDTDILTRGPIHEAYAEPVEFDPEPTQLIPVTPPDPIHEFPPLERPIGVNVEWIPGYWAWDDDMNDYIWVSGIWRDIPPGREWIAGYWAQSSGGFQWVGGYWEDVDVQQTLYLPEPPATVETGPIGQPPSPDVIWTPGTWVWHEQRYAWRPGYWVTGRPDWAWMPARYVWTPRGYVFVDGYWDRTLEDRGVLFAPVHFGRQIRTRPNFYYAPQTVIDIRVITDHLFIHPRRSHYFFGDYYDDTYTRRGYRPWFTARSSRRIYDPIYAHRRWAHRNERDWDDRLRRDFQHRRSNRDARPPRTWADHNRLRRDRRDSNSPIRSIAKTLMQITQRKQSPLRFQRIDDGERRRLGQRNTEIQRIQNDRRKIETRNDGRPDRRHATRTKPARVERPKSTIRSRPTTDLGKDRTPPKRDNPSRIDGKVQARRRAATRETKRDNNSDKRASERKPTERKPEPRRQDDRKRDGRDRNKKD